MDYVKSSRMWRRSSTLLPSLVIVDEAHTAPDASKVAGEGISATSWRVASPSTPRATFSHGNPHSGKEEAFHPDRPRSVIPRATGRPLDRRARARASPARSPDGAAPPRRHRTLPGRHAVPGREVSEATYSLTPEYRALEKVLAYARETVADPGAGGTHRQRVLVGCARTLRALASSPAAAASTLRNRARTADTVTVEEADEVGRRDVLDLVDDESAEGIDVTPGADAEEEDPELPNRRRLNALAREADALAGDGDPKLKQGVALIKQLVADGYNPIVFCRFIPTRTTSPTRCGPSSEASRSQQ